MTGGTRERKGAGICTVSDNWYGHCLRGAVLLLVQKSEIVIWAFPSSYNP